MPRDASGNFAFTPSTVAPAVTLTAISATDFNAAMDDIAAELQDSLSRSGKGGLATPMEFSDGSEVEPGVTFANATGTGLFRDATGMGVSYVGNEVARFKAAGVDVTGDLAVSNDLAVTGVATFTGTPVLSAGISGLTKTSLPALDQVASSAFTADTNSTTGADLGSEITLPAATGRPVLVMLQSANTGFGMNVYVESDAGGGRYATIEIHRKVGAGAYASVAKFYGSSAASTTAPVSVPPFLDTPGAGAVSYKVVGLVSNALGRVYMTACQLVAFEL